METLSQERRGGGRGPKRAAVAVAVLAAAGIGGWWLLQERGETVSIEPRPGPRAAAVPAARPPSAPASGTGALEIAAPGDATVWVDGERLGAGPRSADLEAGSHRVRVEKPGHQAFEREVHVIPGRTLRLEARLEAEAARLSVDADVASAQVFLDREFVGRTPLVIDDVSPGPHRLNVSAEGYDGHSETIEVASGTREVMIRFKEVRLDERIAVTHRHGLGSCRGHLIATADGLRYETDHAKDGFSLALAALEPLEVDYLKSNLRVRQRGGRTWNFTAESADALLVFQRAVEKARARLSPSGR